MSRQAWRYKPVTSATQEAEAGGPQAWALPGTQSNQTWQLNEILSQNKERAGDKNENENGKCTYIKHAHNFLLWLSPRGALPELLPNSCLSNIC